jgi:hypothetical protein
VWSATGSETNVCGSLTHCPVALLGVTSQQVQETINYLDDDEHLRRVKLANSRRFSNRAIVF